jgi:ketosteroid isomerase-like protein
MASADVELARRFISAFNARDVEGLIALCDPAVEFVSVLAAVEGRVYRGHEGVRAWHRDLEVLGDVRVQPEAYFDLDEQLLVFYVASGRGQASGVEVAMPNAAVARSRDGAVVYYRAYTHRADALRDLGVTEDELEPIAP